MKTEDILAERQKIYGTFADSAKAARALKQVIIDHSLTNLEPDMQEALDQICSKISRILTGSSDHVDSWDDIAGYAKLVADRLRPVPTAPTPGVFRYNSDELNKLRSPSAFLAKQTGE